jgi:hypothetical protein
MEEQTIKNEVHEHKDKTRLIMQAVALPSAIWLECEL